MDGMDGMGGWMVKVIIGRRSSKSTFGANNSIQYWIQYCFPKIQIKLLFNLKLTLVIQFQIKSGDSIQKSCSLSC